MRLNQFISESGMCSRREADRLIEQNKVTLNGKVAKVGMQAEEGDIVLVNGRRITKEEENVCILLNKPVGVTSTTDTKDKTNIVDFVNYPKRLFMIGRLDKDSEGAIILTNNGNYVNALLRTENEHQKVYIVKVDKPISDLFLNRMSNGVKIFNPVGNCYVVTKKCKTCKINTNTFEITLTQGFNRQIRRMCDELGYNVVSLKRTKFLFLSLGNLKTGQWRKLTGEEIKKIEKICASSKTKN